MIYSPSDPRTENRNNSLPHPPGEWFSSAPTNVATTIVLWVHIMNHRKFSTFLLAVVVISWLQFAGPLYARPSDPSQNAKAEPDNTQFNPLKYLTSDFPKSVTLKKQGHLLEFCPDDTCNGFVSSADVPVPQLKDFAYLYVYFFSQNALLPEWRSHPEAKNAAEHVLSKPEYHNCKRANALEGARCVLLDLSRDKRIKLIFVRYDENVRNVVALDIRKELSEKPASTSQ